MPVFKERDSTCVILSDRCRARLDEAQFRGEFATKVHFLITRGHDDEFSLARGDSEDGSESQFPREGRAVTAQQDIAQRAAERRLVVGPAGIGKAKELARLKRGFDSLRTPCQIEMFDTLGVTKDFLGIAIVLTSKPGHTPGERVEGTHDLGDRVDADVEQFTTNLAYVVTYNVRVRDIRERNGSEVRTNRHQENTESQFGIAHCSRRLSIRPLDRH